MKGERTGEGEDKDKAGEGKEESRGANRRNAREGGEEWSEKGEGVMMCGRGGCVG